MKADVHKRIAIVRDRLKAVADQKQKESGIYEDVSLESGLAVLVRLSEILISVEPELKPYLVTKLDLQMKAPKRNLELVIAFRGEDFREKIGVVVEGTMTRGGYFQSDRLMVSHNNEYKAPEKGHPVDQQQLRKMIESTKDLED